MDIPVLIVGAGPAGLCTSIMLSRLGVRSLVVERHAGTSIHPKATDISLRTMELLRQRGLDHQVREAALDAWFVQSVRASTLASPEVKVTSLGYPDEEESRRLGIVSPAALAQDYFEPILLEAARSYDGAEVRFNTELTTIRQDEASVHATLVDRATNRMTRVRAQYVIGADGISSAVRQAANIAFEGPAQVGTYISVLFRADLSHLAPMPQRGLYMVQWGGHTGLILPTSRDGAP